MKRLQSKITLTYIVLIVLVTVGIGILSSLELENCLTNLLIDEMIRQADMAAVFLKGAERTTQPQSLTERIVELSNAVHLRITLIDAKGKVIGDSDVRESDLPIVENHLSRPEVQTALRHGVGTDSRHSQTVGLDMMYVAKVVEPLSSQGLVSNVKFIRLAMPLTEVQKEVNEVRFKIGLASLIVIGLVIAISLQVSRQIAKPITRIAQGVREIQSGNLDRKIEITSRDEIGQLASAFNSMMEKLKSDILQLRKLERVRSEFLANVSHELRTPIFSIQGFIETLLDGAIDDPAVNRDFLEKARQHTIRLNNLLNDLIEISRIESGDMKMSFRYFDIEDFLKQVVDEMKSEAEKKGIDLRYLENKSRDVEALGDKERLKQVMINLIDNALKYTDSGGKADVYFEDGENLVKVFVKDTGCGIAQEHIPRIFERFYRVDKDRSREVGGTGLGLAIVKHIVEAHKGELIVQSELKKGSTFGFTLRK